jgi:hypothetical protein
VTRRILKCDPQGGDEPLRRSGGVSDGRAPPSHAWTVRRGSSGGRPNSRPGGPSRYFFEAFLAAGFLVAGFDVFLAVVDADLAAELRFEPPFEPPDFPAPFLAPDDLEPPFEADFPPPFDALPPDFPALFLAPPDDFEAPFEADFAADFTPPFDALPPDFAPDLEPDFAPDLEPDFAPDLEP